MVPQLLSEHDISTDSHDSEPNLIHKLSLSRSSRYPMVAQTNFKTELCKNFEAGKPCKWGLNCCFAHGKTELRSRAFKQGFKARGCRGFNESGICSYGVRCQFQHSKVFHQFRDNQELMESALTSRLELQPDENLKSAIQGTRQISEMPRLKLFENICNAR